MACLKVTDMASFRKNICVHIVDSHHFFFFIGWSDFRPDPSASIFLAFTTTSWFVSPTTMRNEANIVGSHREMVLSVSDRG